MSTLDILKSRFGFDKFRDKQQEIVEDALKNIDQFVVLPTGSGKSICYQLPALIQNGITIVVSPLKSLILEPKMVSINPLISKQTDALFSSILFTF